MSRRKSSSFADLLDLIFTLPPKLGLALIALIFIAMRWVFPHFAQPAPGDSPMQSMLGNVFGPLSHKAAPYFACLLLIPWALGLLKRHLNHKRLDAQTGRDSIRQLSWQEFESLLAAYYERHGYAVEHTGSNTPDGGVDLRLRRDHQTTLVQCKHWQKQDVGVEPVRALRGLVATQNATRGILVTSGQFTPAAQQEFKHDNAIELVNGDELEEMIREARRPRLPPLPSKEGPREENRKSNQPPPLPTTTATPPCPHCQSPMVERTAKKGRNTGGKFWGCPRYPACGGIREMAG